MGGKAPPLSTSEYSIQWAKTTYWGVTLSGEPDGGPRLAGGTRAPVNADDDGLLFASWLGDAFVHTS